MTLVEQPGLPRRVAIVTPFWDGDVEQARAQWVWMHRLGRPVFHHYHLYKLGASRLPHVTFERAICLDIEQAYPELCERPHPAGTNISFYHGMRQMHALGYTHMFWLDPDCIPLDPKLVDRYVGALDEHPDAPIIGGGGTPQWKHHYPGCVLYNLSCIAALNWDDFIQNHLEESFDVWISIQLGFIRPPESKDNSQDTIYFGGHQYQWVHMNRTAPMALQLFEHWRPQKFLTEAERSRRAISGRHAQSYSYKKPAMVDQLLSSNPPFVSIVIFNYNYGRFLRQAIDSALDQTYAHIEVIVVDDGSSDESIEIIDSYGSRIKALKMSHGLFNPNYNQQRLLHCGLRACKGSIICLLDADDTMASSKVETIAPLFNDYQIVAVQHSVNTIDADGKILGKGYKLFGGVTEITLDLYRKTLRTGYFQPTSALVFSRHYLDFALSFCRFDGFSNVWLDVRLGRPSPLFGRVLCVAADLGSWRKHGESDSSNTSDLLERVMDQGDWFNSVARRFGMEIDYLKSDHLKKITEDPRHSRSITLRNKTDEECAKFPMGSDFQRLRNIEGRRIAMVAGVQPGLARLGEAELEFVRSGRLIAGNASIDWLLDTCPPKLHYLALLDFDLAGDQIPQLGRLRERYPEIAVLCPSHSREWALKSSSQLQCDNIMHATDTWFYEESDNSGIFPSQSPTIMLCQIAVALGFRSICVLSDPVSEEIMPRQKFAADYLRLQEMAGNRAIIFAKDWLSSVRAAWGEAAFSVAGKD